VSDPRPDGIDKERQLDPGVSTIAEDSGGCRLPGQYRRTGYHGCDRLTVGVADNFKILLTAIGWKTMASARFVHQEDHMLSDSSGSAALMQTRPS
jgi:hypothetical protein